MAGGTWLRVNKQANTRSTDSGAWIDRRNRGPGPVTFEEGGIPFVTTEVLGIAVARAPTEKYTVVISGLEVHAAR